jgi:hypothetical protein
MTAKERSSEKYKKMEALTHVCDYALFSNTTFSSGIKNEAIPKYLHNLSPSLDEVLDICRWKNKVVDCGSLFRETLTDEGSCFTFNSLSLSQIYSEER